jgi:hypothetical protein
MTIATCQRFPLNLHKDFENIITKLIQKVSIFQSFLVTRFKTICKNAYRFRLFHYIWKPSATIT